MSSENLKSGGSFTDLSSKIEPKHEDVDKKNEETNESVNKTTSSTSNSSISSTSSAVKLVKSNHTFRKGLPGSMSNRNSVSIWSILKQCVDKELYRFTIPIVWNEPLSLLQRMAENMRYANELLDRAADLTSPVDRMKCVAGFLISCTSIHTARLSKPFNPLLGETYEYTCSRNKFRICCEQVSHHPPVSAYYSESLRPSTKGDSVRKWKYYGSVEPAMKLNLLNACVEAFPNGIQTLEFPEHGEIYTWHNLKVTAHNLILGKLWFEYTGRAEIVNHKLNMKCILEFKPYSWFSRQLNHCEGYIADANDNKLCLLNGKWDECFFASTDVKNASKFSRVTERLINHENESQLTGIETVWKTVPTEGDLKPEFFFFSSFTFELNELYQDLIESTQIEVKETTKKDGKEVELTNAVRLGPIAPTDSRFRPDMQLYEKGLVDEASEQKHRLEEKQRDKQRRTEAGELAAFQPLWFDKGHHPVVKDEETWTFNDSYWKRDFNKCPDIY